MGRRRKGRAVDGILLLDKPVGLSSNHAVQRIRGIYQARKVGHGGTLDPFAEGLLPVLIGEATKFGRFLLNADKTYQVTMTFGSETDTDDLTGTIIRLSKMPDLNNIDWHHLLSQFIGCQLQQPPIYSALKVGGKRAYVLARQGNSPELAPRTITIHELNLISHDEQSATLSVRCSKGTYIRALVRDIGRATGSAAHASALRRCTVGQFNGNFHSLDELSVLRDTADFSALDALLLPFEHCVDYLDKAIIPDEKLYYFRHGNDVALSAFYSDGEYAFYHDDSLLGVGHIKDNRAYPERLCVLQE